MSSNLDQIRDQQRDTWGRFSAGWKSWDDLVMGCLAPFGNTMIRHAHLRDNSEVLDIAAGTGEPVLSAAAMVPLEWEPCTRWQYGAGSDVMARGVEVVAGMPLARFFATRIVEPLGISDNQGYSVGIDDTIVRLPWFD